MIVEPDVSALQQILHTAVVEKAINELWQTASPGLRQKLADAVVESAVKSVTDMRSFGSPINEAVRQEIQGIVAKVVEEKQAEIAELAVKQLREALARRLESMMCLPPDAVLAAALVKVAEHVRR